MPNALGNLLVSDIVNAALARMGETTTNTIRSNAVMIAWVDEASQVINRDVEFPECRWLINTLANYGEYALNPYAIKVDRVYLNGMLIIPTDEGIQTLEGHQIGMYDDTGQNTSSNLSIAPVTGTNGTYIPAWMAQATSAYPPNTLGGVSPAQPWINGQRPRSYWRGGVIGIVPAPASAGTQNLVVEGVGGVPELENLNDSTQYPRNFLTALAWKVVELAKFADDSDRASESRNYAASQYDKHMRQLRTWNRRRTGDAPRTPKVKTNRSVYITGQNRYNSGGGTGWEW